MLWSIAANALCRLPSAQMMLRRSGEITPVLLLYDRRGISKFFPRECTIRIIHKRFFLEVVKKSAALVHLPQSVCNRFQLHLRAFCFPSMP